MLNLYKKIIFAILSFFIITNILAPKTLADEIVVGNSPDDDFMRLEEEIKKSESIKNDISKPQQQNLKKPEGKLAKDFASSPESFQSEKNSLEQDKGFYINQKNAVDSKQIPKYPDRSGNKGLVGGLLNVLDEKDDSSKNPKQNTNQSPPSPKKVEELKVNLSEEKSSGFFDKLKQIAKSATSFFTSEEKKVAKPVNEVKKKVNLADTFPDPTFYKIRKTDKYYKIPISILNDKTNVENLHIPTADLGEDYKILYLLFTNIKGESKQEQIRAMLDYTKNKNLINTRDQYGNTLLNYAVRFNNLQSFHALMEYGANPNVCNNSGICPIHLAIFNYQNYIFDLLLKANTKYDLADMNGIDPLIYSIYSGNFYAFQKLLELEPYKNLKQSDFAYLLEFAQEGENYELYQFIQSKSLPVN